MMYNYSYNEEVVYLPMLESDIKDSSLTSHYAGCSYNSPNLVFHFDISLNENEINELNSIVANHVDSFQNSFEYLFITSYKTQEQNIAFGQKLLHDWMRKNTLEGMSVKQSIWVFSRFEDFEVQCDFGSKKVDLFKMFYSGALPTVYFCLLQVAPDPMTEDYHWLTQERIDWVKEQIEEFIGEGAAGHIQNLVSQSQ